MKTDNRRKETLEGKSGLSLEKRLKSRDCYGLRENHAATYKQEEKVVV